MIILRTLKRHKSYAVPSLLAFALSLSLTLFALICIVNERQYDTFHPDYNNIYRVTSELIYKSGTTSTFARVMPWVGPYLMIEFPEVEAVARFQKPEEAVIRVDDKQIKETNVTWVDSAFFTVFGFKLAQGSPDKVFKHLGSAVLTRETAIEYFGTTDAIGETITVAGNHYEVTGVVEDGSVNSHFSFNVLLNSYYLTRGWTKTESGTHRSMFVYTYVKFKNGFSIENFTGKLKNFEDRHLTVADLSETGLSDWTLSLQPIADIHLGSKMKRELEDNIEPSTLDLISIVTLIIVMIAGFNYVVINIAVYSQRMKEIAIKKVHGALQKIVVLQFVRESMLFILIAFILALIFLTIELTVFGNPLTNRAIDTTVLYSPWLLATIPVAAIVTGLIGAVYPSVIFGTIKPINIFHPKKDSIGSLTFLHRLSTVQAIVSIVMIGFTYGVILQTSFFNMKDYGFDKDNLIVVSTPPRWSQFEPFRNELMHNPKIADVCQVLNSPGGFVEEGMVRAEGHDETFLMPSYDGCENFVETMGLKLVEGRTLSTNDDWTSVVINEAAVERFGWQGSAIGRKIFSIEQRGVEVPYTVVGVVKDFHYHSVRDRVEPFRIHVRCNRVNDILVRVEAGTTADVVEGIAKAWGKVDANSMFDYTIVRDVYASKYGREQKLINIFMVFSILAIIIAAIGFYGISSITGNRRAKEIAIRKTLGATVLEIFGQVMARAIRPTIIAIVISMPILYLAVDNWLSQFAYTAEIDPKIFLVPSGIICVVAIVSFSYFIVRASRAEPGRILRSE